MAKTVRNLKSGHQSNIVKLLNSLEGRQSRWQIWQDFITMSAIAISNCVDAIHRDEREKSFELIAKKYSESEKNVFAQMLAEVVNGMEENPDQDFLGELFMGLELGNDWKGQFFTPYSVCRMMAAISCTDVFRDTVKEKGWVGVNDPACGAGALLLAFANECKTQNVNFQTSVLFVAQDLDLLAGLMCYIQLSLLGCPGYVVIGDSLCNPSTSYDARGLLPKDQDIWYTPMYCSAIWTGRRTAAKLDLILKNEVEPLEPAGALQENEQVSKYEDKGKSQPKAVATTQTAYKETESGQLTFF